MPRTIHTERHFTASDTVRDVVIGMSDGLTVPFALAAGLSGAIAQSNIVVTAGLAEIAAGSIAMGLGGYLAAKSDAEHYAAEKRKEEQEIIDIPREEMREVSDIFRHYGIPEEHIRPVVHAMSERPREW
ncbi:MAG: VIT1/CCC1 transporter family protein, partial [Thermoanaerobaculia bacterium]